MRRDIKITTTIKGQKYYKKGETKKSNDMDIITFFNTIHLI